MNERMPITVGGRNDQYTWDGYYVRFHNSFLGPNPRIFAVAGSEAQAIERAEQHLDEIAVEILMGHR